ncbi:MAG: nucleotide exchange factor GrpE [Thermoleophilia bacterium]
MHPHEQDIEQEAAPEAPAPPAPAPDDASASGDAAAGSAAPSSDGDPAQSEPGRDPEAGGGDVRERAAKADEYLALAQRTQADFENFRKRMSRDVRAAEARGMSRLAKELLPALDNLDRAIAAVEASGEQQEHQLTKGIRLLQSELSAALARTGIESYAAKGERFDPVHHEAVAQTPVEGAEPGSIVEVLQSGYRLNEHVLRPARVVVAG